MNCTNRFLKFCLTYIFAYRSHSVFWWQNRHHDQPLKKKPERMWNGVTRAIKLLFKPPNPVSVIAERSQTLDKWLKMKNSSWEREMFWLHGRWRIEWMNRWWCRRRFRKLINGCLNCLDIADFALRLITHLFSAMKSCSDELQFCLIDVLLDENKRDSNGAMLMREYILCVCVLLLRCCTRTGVDVASHYSWRRVMWSQHSRHILPHVTDLYT